MYMYIYIYICVYIIFTSRYIYIYIYYYDWTAFCPAFGARRELRTKFHSQIEWFFVPLLLGCLKHT